MSPLVLEKKILHHSQPSFVSSPSQLTFSYPVTSPLSLPLYRFSSVSLSFTFHFLVCLVFPFFLSSFHLFPILSLSMSSIFAPPSFPSGTTFLLFLLPPFIPPSTFLIGCQREKTDVGRTAAKLLYS